VPVVTRRRSVRVLVVVAAGFPLLLAAGTAVLTVMIGQTCTGSRVGDAPSSAAVRDIPGRMLAIYQQVGAQYKLPWEILAGIGKEECDHGQLSDPSCTPQPGAKGPGVANFAGASGPMQSESAAPPGDEYDALRHFLPDPSLGPHDPTTAVELAALVLIKDKGAPTGQPINAYRDYARAYNGAGPMAEAYAARVVADAHTYQGAGTISVGAGCSAAFGTPIVPGTKARILADGVAAAPADAPAEVQAMIAAGNRINHFPYSYGGAHGDPAQTMSQTSPNPGAVPGAEENGGPGYDCSSATSYVLWGGGLGQSLLGGCRRRLDRARARRRLRSGSVGDDLRERRPRIPRGRWRLLRHRRRARQPAQPAAHRSPLEQYRHRATRVRRAASARAVIAPERVLRSTIHANSIIRCNESRRVLSWRPSRPVSASPEHSYVAKAVASATLAAGRDAIVPRSGTPEGWQRA